MKNKKIIPLVVILVLMILGITSISIFSLNAREKKDSNINVSIEKNQLKKNDKPEEVQQDSGEQIELDQHEEQKKVIIDTSESTKNNVSISENDISTSSVSKNNNSNNLTSNNDANIPKTDHAQTAVTPSCTPKKFDMSFVRPDFDSFAGCTSMGDKYKASGYGYFCDAYQDDCGTTYYMLTIYERNTGYEYDFHTIQIP